MFFKKPSNYHRWSEDQTLPPHGEFLDTMHVRMHNIRDVSYRSENDFDVRHHDAEYDLGTVTSLWFMVMPFDYPGVAHTLLSFGFEDGRTLALSVEVRKKKGEQFSLWRMVPQMYELMYVFAEESDVVRLRAAIWKHPTYFFPLRISSVTAQHVLRDAITRANNLRTHPEFYHPTANNCTNNLIFHLRAAGVSLPHFSWRYVFPETITSLLFSYDLLPLGETPASIREKYLINGRAKECTDPDAFSACIRAASDK